ncbi:5124_t:CDS:1, partial [Scutellospora calospora]
NGVNSNDINDTSWDTHIKDSSEDKKEKCDYLISKMITKYFPENETNIFALLPKRSDKSAFK